MIKRLKMKKLTYNYVKEFIKEKGYTLLLDTYENNYTKLNVKCPKCHEYKVHFSHFKNGSRCPQCQNKSKSSRGEQEVSNFIKSQNINVIENDRTQIINPLTGHNLELDVWIPSLNKAIEYNGTYWHSKPYQKVKDLIKKEQCDKKGSDLLIIKDKEWKNNQGIIEKEIEYFLNEV